MREVFGEQKMNKITKKHHKQCQSLEKQSFEPNFTASLYNIRLENEKRYKTLETFSKDVLVYFQKSLTFLFYYDALISKITRNSGLLGNMVTCA